MTGGALIVQGDALHLPLPDESVDLCVTSPPYFSLRSYSAGPSEIGSEPTPAAYLEALWAATAEMARVLKPGGSMFVDLGDKYSGAQAQNFNGQSRTDSPTVWAQTDPRRTGIPNKSLMLLPERYRIGCVDRLGLIARAVIVWDKPNGLPESVTDRVRRSHEDWVHLTREPRYYSATDEIREVHAPGSFEHHERYGNQYGRKDAAQPKGPGHTILGKLNPLGKLPGSVWSIPSEPLRLPEHLGVQHYAAFPSEWPRRLILGFSPPGICVECGTGRVPVVERVTLAAAYRDLPLKPGDVGRNQARPRDADPLLDAQASGLARPGWRNHLPKPPTILGYACSCTPHTDHPGSGESSGPQYSNSDAMAAQEGIYRGGAAPCDLPSGGLWNRPKVGPWREYHLDRWTPPPTRPAVVLDSFGGTGTVAMVAKGLDRIGISLDLSMPYCRAARWRVRYGGDKAISRTNLERQGTLDLTATVLEQWQERHDGINALGGHA